MKGLWGKALHNGEVQIDLPLVLHLADVAATFEALVNLDIYMARACYAASRNIVNSDISRLSCLAAIHDIGKATPGFQNKNHPGGHPVHGHILPLSGLFAGNNGPRVIQALPFLTEWDERSGAVTEQYLAATFSHHGEPLSEFESVTQERLWPSDPMAPAWQFLNELGQTLRQWFPEAFRSEAPPLPASPALQHLFAGLVMLADWIGSDTRFFPLDRPRSQGEELAYSRLAASRALTAIGLDTSPYRKLTPVSPTFEEQFPFPANALQREMDNVPLRQDGGVTIIEAETGYGKTEAALRLFFRMWSTGLVDGLYFANPLRFAATQLFGRISRFVSRNFPGKRPPTVLAVPGYVQVDEATGTLLPGFEVLWDDAPGRLTTEQRWAAEHPKRFLAAPVAVGTIDQALLGVLRVRHAHLRAAAISRSLLVIDEVHASDTYMTRLTTSLLQLFRRTGGQTLLLSATLGGHVRDKYLHVYRKKRDAPGLKQCLDYPYPCVTTIGGAISVADDRPQEQRKLPIRVIVLPLQEQPEAIAERTAELAAQGGRILVLRNSVRSARETLACLQRIVPPQLLFSVNGLIAPHHSRYAKPDRKRLDAEVEKRFGPHGSCLDGILVSTQTLEQSLDVDFDVMITDLCPMDILLQRLGRLHRHRKRDAHRPIAHAKPQCFLLTPERQSAQSLREAKQHQYGKDRAYDNLLAVMAAWERILELDQSGQPVRVPEMCRDLVDGTLHPDALTQVAKRHGMQKEFNELLGVRGAQAQAAGLASIDWSQPFTRSAGNQDESRIGTRLGLRDRAVDFSETFASPFGADVDQLIVPQWMCQDLPEDVKPIVLERQTHVFRFRLGDANYCYDRYGLEKEPS